MDIQRRCGLSLILACLASALAAADTPEPTRPVVPGVLLLKQRFRDRAWLAEQKAAGRVVEPWRFPPAKEREVEWKAAETAIIVCDMWDDHHCKSAAQRVGVMAPRMNAVLTAARNLGVQIIHAPSETMDVYANTTFRKRMVEAPRATPPVPIQRWCSLDRSTEPPLPIDDSDGGDDDPHPTPGVRKWTRQHAAIDIIGYDGISDRGEEIYSYCKANGICNIAIMGVHTNMCVLGRSFGIRQMTRLGMNVVLVRDLTDAMYDPRERPQVSHTRGTQLVIEHIETYWCPSILSRDLTRVIEGSDNPSSR